MSTASTAEATGVPGAASAMEGLLAREDTENTPQTETTEAPQEGASPAESEEQETAPEEQSEEVSPEEEASTTNEESEEQPPAPVLVTVTIDGKTEQLPIEEVAKGYQRSVDYTRKTQDLADDRRVIEAEKQQVAQERAQYAQILPALVQRLQAEPEPNWAELSQTDPLEYLRQKDLHRDRQDQIAAAQFEMTRTANLQQQERAASLRKMRDEGLRKLPELIPEWKDAKKWEEDRKALLDYGPKAGFTAEELAQTYDPRAVVALHKARLYDKLMANKPKPVENKGPRVLPAGSTNTAPRTANAGARAKERLAKSGRVSDAASFFEATME